MNLIKNRKVLSLSLTSLLLSTFLVSPSLASSNDKIDETLKALDVYQLKLKVEDTDIPNIKNVLLNSGEGLLITDDGKHLLDGKIYTFDKKSGQLVDASQKHVFNDLVKIDDTAIEFKAKDEKYVVRAFVDITCSFCKRLTENMDKYNELGITFKYFAYPRAGVDSEVAQEMETIFTKENNKDRAELIVKAEHGEKVEKSQEIDIVKDHFFLANRYQVRGTPTLILPNGTALPGFLEPDQLIKVLEEQDK